MMAIRIGLALAHMRKLALAVAVVAAPAMAATADSSFAVDEYVRRGVPPIDRPWSVADFVAAQQALLNLKIGELPHWSSARSRKIVEKLTDRRMLDVFTDHSVAPNIRLAALAQFTAAQQRLAAPYAAATGIAWDDDEDILHFAALFLQTLVVRLDLQDELASPRAGHGPPLAMELEQIQQSRATLGPSIRGLCNLLQEPGGAGRAFLAAAVAAAYPRLAYRLPADARADLDATLRKLARDDSDAQVRSALAGFAAAR